MALIRVVHAPDLLVRASHALGMTQASFGELFGVSRRTMVRWHQGQNGPPYQHWVDLVRHVHPRNPALAAEIASELGETLVSLGVEAPPAPVTHPGSRGEASARAAPPVGDLVDSIVCAAAEAIAATPQAVRPALLAAFERAASVGLAVDDVRGALRPPAKTKKS
jgi:DNA-binding XRE family transcriptional regulator